MSDHAIQRGISRIQYKGVFRKWLDSYMREGQELYVYGDKVFIFTNADHVLITVLQIPQSLSNNAKAHKLRKHTSKRPFPLFVHEG